MKINARQIPFEGLALEEQVWPVSLGLEDEQLKFSHPLKLKAQVSRITNAISLNLIISGKVDMLCSRCLKEIEVSLDKEVTLHYEFTGSDQVIDLGPDIREEIILDYPVKPLCKGDCKGLCPKCGGNLNEGGCSCGIT